MTLLEEIKNGESVALEFKEARPKDSLKFTKTVVAFANGRGGRILFGVEDRTGRLVGIPRDKVAVEMDAIADAVANTCTPSVPIDIKPTTLEGKVLGALDVKSGSKIVGTQRRDVYELPLDSIREAILSRPAFTLRFMTTGWKSCRRAGLLKTS